MAEKKNGMRLDELLSSRPWTLAVDRGFRSVPFSYTAYYKYTFCFSGGRKGYLSIESTTADGNMIRKRNGLNSQKIINPFTLVYGEDNKKTAIIRCNRLHAQQKTAATKKTTYEYEVNPPMLFHCELRRDIWCIHGNAGDTRAFFTPYTRFNDHFGYTALLFGTHVNIHVSAQEMTFHILSSGHLEITVCRTVNVAEEDQEEEDLDLEKELKDIIVE